MKTYHGEFLQEIAFPLSGIGTGGVSLSGNGRLIDWELIGRPNKGGINEYTHFAIKSERHGKVLQSLVLQGDETKDLGGIETQSHHGSWGYGQGINRTSLAGFQHFEDVSFCGRFPFAEMDFKSRKLPAAIHLSAFNPFVPGNENDSSIPAAFFAWTIENQYDEETEFTLAFSCGNPFSPSQGGFERFSSANGVSKILLSMNRAEDPNWGEIEIATDCKDVGYQEHWFRGGWFDDLTVFWNDFNRPGKLRNRGAMSQNPNEKSMATLEARVSLKPKERKTIRFVLAFYFPRFEKYWGPSRKEGGRYSWNHEYVRRYRNCAEVTSDCFARRDSLEHRSKAFSDLLCSSSLPEAMLEAVVDNLSVLKSSTCLRLENGDFYAFEGSGAHEGSCEGTCDHVYAYEYALPFLFPHLARTTLENSYRYNVNEEGAMDFRLFVPFGEGRIHQEPAIDGQFGAILRFYREWKLSGDEAWLKAYWPTVRKTLEYAWSEKNESRWDPEKKGYLSGRQAHTLDMELFGPSSWLSGYYLAALKACAEIAEHLGEKRKAEEYQSIFFRGKAYVDSNLFNGDYYTQKIDLSSKGILDAFEASDPNIGLRYWNEEANEMKYQINEGCEIDQMVGEWHAGLLGLGEIFDPTQARIASKNLYANNFRSMRDLNNPCRVFACNDEKGMIICSWPKGREKPAISIPYTEECMSGFEYAAAGLFLQKGMEQEARTVVEAIRERYDGKKRNPFSEIECGASYARSMASYALLLSESGFVYDLPKRLIGFRPRHSERPLSFFWSVDGAWGGVLIDEDSLLLSIQEGSLTLDRFALPSDWKIDRALIDGCDVPFSFSKGEAIFPKTALAKRSIRFDRAGRGHPDGWSM